MPRIPPVQQRHRFCWPETSKLAAIPRTPEPGKSRDAQRAAEVSPERGFGRQGRALAANSAPRRAAFSTAARRSLLEHRRDLERAASSVRPPHGRLEPPARTRVQADFGLPGAPSDASTSTLAASAVLPIKYSIQPTGVQNRRLRAARARAPSGHCQRFGRLLLANRHVVGEVVQRDGVVWAES
jgi:hypothetical protein